MGTIVAEPQDRAATAPAGKPANTRIQVAGLILAGAGPAFMLALALLSGMDVSEDIGFFGAGILVPWLAGALAWRFGTWAKVLGVVAALAVAFGFFWTVFGLFEPRSFGDFVPGVLVPLGVVMAVAGGVAALVATRRGRLTTAATSTERRVLTVVAAVVVIAVLGSGVANLVTRSVAEELPGAVAITIEDFAFGEGTVTIPAGEATTLRVHNADPFHHTFTIPDLGVDEMLLPGSSVNIEVTAAAGSYTIYCAPHSNMNEPDPEQAGMAATLVAQ